MRPVVGMVSVFGSGCGRKGCQCERQAGQKDDFLHHWPHLQMSERLDMASVHHSSSADPQINVAAGNRRLIHDAASSSLTLDAGAPPAKATERRLAPVIAIFLLSNASAIRIDQRLSIQRNYSATFGYA
jgi:hypothetical protein